MVSESKAASDSDGGGVIISIQNLSLDPPRRKKNRKKKKKGDEPPAIVANFDSYFGDISKLQNWQNLCRDLSIEPVPGSLTQCRKALRGIWVNIVDFLENKKNNRPQKFFESRKALARYTRETGKIYPKKSAKKEGPLRELLAHIF